MKYRIRYISTQEIGGDVFRPKTVEIEAYSPEDAKDKLGSLRNDVHRVVEVAVLK